MRWYITASSIVAGEGDRQRYSVAGEMYRDWFLSAGKLSAPEAAKALETPQGIQVLIEHIEQHIGAQTNIAGDAQGDIASGKFESATALGGGEATDQSASQGPLYKPNDTVEQAFDAQGGDKNE